MMKYCRFVIIVTLVVCTASPLLARRKSQDFFLKPQAGVWFGPITPVYTTSEDVETRLGGGVFARYNLPWAPLKLGVDASYQHFKSQGVKELTLWPVYGNLLFRLPINLPLAFQFKLGAGGSSVEIQPEDQRQWDPLFMVGVEGSFPAGKWVNIGLRIDYLLIYEKHIEGAQRNGNIVNTGITLYLNIGI